MAIPYQTGSKTNQKSHATALNVNFSVSATRQVVKAGVPFNHRDTEATQRTKKFSLNGFTFNKVVINRSEGELNAGRGC